MIFVHSSFRTASTFLWSSLRNAPGTVAYYEVFNEGLDFFTRSQIMTLLPEDWHSGHPAAAPYFLEFLPLLRPEGGVEGFDPAISYERFIPANGCGGDISAAEKAYVSHLIAHAEGRGRTPVLTATRSLGRLRGLKTALPGLHVLLYRNMFQQWCSVTDQAVRGNPFFLEKILGIIKLNQHDPQLRDLLQICPFDTASVEDPNIFYLFVFFHLHLYVQAAGAADLLIDMNRLAAERTYRNNVEDVICRHGATADLSGARNSIAYSVCRLGSARSLMDRLKVIGEMIIDRSPDPAGREFGNRLLADLIEEQARHEFHTQGLRSVLLGPNGSLAAHQDLRLARDAAMAERDRVAGDHAGLFYDRDEALAELTRVAAERNALQVERDAAIGDLNAVRADYEGLRPKLQELANEQAASRLAHDDALAECDVLRREREDLRAERDALLAEREVIRVQRHSAETRRGAMRLERDDALRQCQALRLERDAARAEHDVSAAGLAVTRNERDAAVTECSAIGLERDDMGRERDHLHQLLDAMFVDRETIRLARDRACDERDGLRAELGSIRANLEAARAEQQTLNLDRDRIRSERDGLMAKLEALSDERDRAFSELDALLARQETLVTMIDALNGERNHFAADRDRLRTELHIAQAAQDHIVAERDTLRAEVARRGGLSARRAWLPGRGNFGASALRMTR